MRQCRIHYNPNCQAIELYVFDKNEFTGELTVMKESEYVKQALYAIGESTARLHQDAAQRMIDDLYNAGFRPTEQKHTSETIKAKDEHLSDLRKVLIKYLE